ncbi:dTMP kinase [Candidatus Desulforudis audaxviator]|uniref:dTMP kinase n=1 Tax=Candidatus Desulforudis audaxviator TaxID=471827 RepID=UPI0002DD359D|nr:dTMP kinase [Candidatus Desulforudis audaxviator]AZK58601.1 Thymidylate kinase [Candidatus Desulforudis audaxviator]
MRVSGVFIVFEGIDGAGKTTQLAYLHEALLSMRNHRVLVTREPGGTRIGEAVRRVLLDTGNSEMTGETEALLYAAARSQFTAEVVRPALARGEIVLSDRFLDSSLAYQGFGRGLELHRLRQVNFLATGGLRPDLTVLLDLPVAAAVARMDPDRRDRLEREGVDFFERVRRGYLELASADPGHYLIVNAEREAGVCASAIWARVRALLQDRPTFGGCPGLDGGS